jgi:hypothetical protein
MSTMILIRGKLAADLLNQIGEADYVEGLADDVLKMAKEVRDADNPKVKEVIRLYTWLEKARAEFLVLRTEVNEFLADLDEKTDTAP